MARTPATPMAKPELYAKKLRVKRGPAFGSHAAFSIWVRAAYPGVPVGCRHVHRGKPISTESDHSKRGAIREPCDRSLGVGAMTEMPESAVLWPPTANRSGRGVRCARTSLLEAGDIRPSFRIGRSGTAPHEPRGRRGHDVAEHDCLRGLHENALTRDARKQSRHDGAKADGGKVVGGGTSAVLTTPERYPRASRTSIATNARNPRIPVPLMITEYATAS